MIKSFIEHINVWFEQKLSLVEYRNVWLKTKLMNNHALLPLKYNGCNSTFEQPYKKVPNCQQKYSFFQSKIGRFYRQLDTFRLNHS